eukprot:PhM_4_TR4928/c0_g1_i1/m.89996/K03248/EIF3G; translation initiation factor 3 subunit G
MSNWADEPEDRIRAPQTNAGAAASDVITKKETVTNADGRRVVRITRVRQVPVEEKVYFGIEERAKNWELFGRPKKDPKTLIPGEVTDHCDPVDFVLDVEGGGDGGGVGALEKMTQKNLVEMEKAIKFEYSRVAIREKMAADKEAAEAEEAAVPEKKPGVYQARSSGRGSSIGGAKQEVCSLRIDNLSDETTEEALRILCEKIGRVSRLYLPTMTLRGERRSKGFAFVTFSSTGEAEAAFTRLHRLAFQSAVLSVSWGTKQEKK